MLAKQSFDYLDGLVTLFEYKLPKKAPLIYCMAACFIMSLMTISVKSLGTYPPEELLYIQSVIQLVIMQGVFSINPIQCYMTTSQSSIKTILFFKTIMGYLSAQFWYYSSQMLPASETLLLNNMSPIWTSLFAIVVMKTRQFNLNYFITVSLAIGGTLFVAKPPFMAPLFTALGYEIQVRDAHDELLHMIGVIIGLVGSMISSANQVLLSKLGSLSTTQIFQYNTIAGTLYAVIAYMLNPTGVLIIPSLKDTILIISILGALNVLANLFLFKSFLLGDLVTISLISLSSVIYGFLFDVFIFGNPLDMISLFGCGFIMGGMAIDILLNGPKEK